MSTAQCSHCGGLLPPPSDPWVCSYCGAVQSQPEAPEGCVLLTDDHVLGLLRQRLTGVDATYLHPSVPPKKLANVRAVHAAHLPPDEQVLALYDGTAFGSAKDGFVVTSRRICWKNQLEGAQQLEWKHVDADQVWAEETSLRVGNARLETLYGEDDDGLYVWEEVIGTLARSAHPEKAGSAPARREAGQVDAGWGGAEVAVGPAAGAWGGMAAAPAGAAAVPVTGGYQGPPPPEEEHLPAPPYQVERGCSVVDVHPSGQVVLAAGDDTIVLRHASNGGVVRTLRAPDIVLSARFSPDGSWLLAAGLDRRASLYEVGTGQHRGSTEEMGDSCDEVAWLGSTTRFAMASQSGELWIVDGASMQVTARVLGPDPDYHQLGGIAASRDGSRLFASVGSRLGAFDTTTGNVLWRADDALPNASRLAVSPGGEALVAAGYDGVAFFDGRTGQPGARFPFYSPRYVVWPEAGGGVFGRSEPCHMCWSPRPRFSPSGHSVAVQDHAGNLSFVDPRTGALYPTPRQRGCAWIEDLAWFPDGQHVAVGMSDDSLAFWKVSPMTALLHVQALGPPSGY